VGVTTTLTFPGGAVTETITVTVGLTESQPAPVNFSFLGQTFFVEAWNAVGQPVFDFMQPFTLTIRYADADVFGIDENTLRLYYWDINDEKWLEVIPFVLDTQSNTLIVWLDHLTTFGMMGEDRYWLYLPYAVNLPSPGERLSRAFPRR
jgi:hypothetical protein